jgi:hypothetical protein
MMSSDHIVGLEGALQGQATREWVVPDVGTKWDLQGSGSAAGMGTVSVSGDVHGTGNILRGRALGTLTLDSAGGTVVLSLTQPDLPSFTLPTDFQWTVTSATGDYQNYMNDQGQLRLDLSTDPTTDLTTFTIDLGSVAPVPEPPVYPTEPPGQPPIGGPVPEPPVYPTEPPGQPSIGGPVPEPPVVYPTEPPGQPPIGGPVPEPSVYPTEPPGQPLIGGPVPEPPVDTPAPPAQPPIVSPLPEPPVQPAIVGAKGQATEQLVPDAGTIWNLTGAGTTSGMGAVTVTGSVQGVGFIRKGQAEGTLTLNGADGSRVTLDLQGPEQPAFAPLPQTFHYHIVSSSGNVALPADGQLELVLTPDPNTPQFAAFTLTI